MKRVLGLEWLRAFGCIGIVMMHMGAETNNHYTIDGFLYRAVIPSLSGLIFLFMGISAFALCCGYYEKVLSGDMDWVCFYKKRFARIWPFFAVLVLADVSMAPSFQSLSEGIADLTLLYGLFPNDITVIGVGWFLGLVFAFYLLFPFFCVLIRDRKNAWISFLISVFINYLFGAVFSLRITNIVYCLCYFLAGGIVFLYRADIEKINGKLLLTADLLSVSVYCLAGRTTVTSLLMVVSILSSALKIKKCPPAVSFLSGISMEIYLVHMMCFRIIERLRLNYLLGNGVIQYLFTVTVVMFLSVAAALFIRKGIRFIWSLFSSARNN